ncbi:ribosome biogenesis GTPase Der [candidate division KSB1 bacterium]|nr:ribosome biogenesis GTPase Der [candidate division KSB1 bacterium]
MKKKPVVAILGRPNVGKSTLFNRIVRRREAIVDDESGVTRDRKYAPGEWSGASFELVDTGGYVPGSQDVFEQAIREQVDHAINEADIIVFVVDVTTGITDLDLTIAGILQRSGKQVLLAVNKVDNEMRENEIGEFFRLGLGEPYPVSAMSGRRTGDFLDAIIALLPHKKMYDVPHGDIRLAILGKPNVGKSSYVNALLGEDKHIVTPIPGTTRDAIDTRFRYKEKEIVLIDTAGLRKRSRVKESIEYFSTVRTYNTLHRCDVAVVLFDATQEVSDQDIKILQAGADEGRGLVIGVNKWDAVEKDTHTARRYEMEIREAIKSKSYVPLLFISALTKQRVFRLLDMALSVYEECRREIPTAELNRLLRISIEKNHPPAFGTKWIKINYMTQTRINPPVFAFFTNEPKGIRQNYRNYLENQIRQQYGFMGVPIRLHFRKKN